jgi:hypothetical protein
VLDLWFERMVKPRLRGEACMVRYIYDFVLYFNIARTLYALSACQEAEKIQSDLGTDEDQACRIWSLCARQADESDRSGFSAGRGAE